MSDDGPRPSTRPAPATCALDVDVVRHDGAWTERGISDAMVELATHAALACAPPSKAAHCEVTVVLTDDAEIRDLNRTWRGKDEPTNVLSFPSGDMPDAAGAFDDDTQDGAPVLLGDIVIALETTAAEAAEKAIPLSDHVSHLVVHGALHLLGFDHLDDTEAEQMEDLERQALASLGIADPYADDAPIRDGNAGLAEIA
ncbi:rRNA maturation RNase YbeY [Methyloceanibacter caenitepidi]|uniref:rRNA maturation RNase YbeY n=1 Tax=Methyloceanibacter caenitepidi TaxID=1384459 RepID=UPI000694AA51|nr:rRNA maturation RNase YbeY [Methyloceanibacter caenitepidi]